MKAKSSQGSSTGSKASKLKKATLRDLTAKQAGAIKGGKASIRTIRSRRTDRT